LDAAALSVAVSGAVAFIASVSAVICVFVLARSARERRTDFLRAIVIERQAQLATNAYELPAREALSPDSELVDEGQRHEPLATQVQSYQSTEMRKAMVESRLNPDDPEDVSLYIAMLESGLDPTHPDDVAYWNMREGM
tara:strand:+ start:3689 stop:4105 length:417 start_codon:yes stop_codon:yes gene_type:complete